MSTMSTTWQFLVYTCMDKRKKYNADGKPKKKKNYLR